MGVFGSTPGHLSDRITQRWVQLTGRRVTLEEAPFLSGPVGDPGGIGSDYFDKLAAREGLTVHTERATGLLRMADLAGPKFDPAGVHPDVVDFYQRTPGYTLDVWSEWCGAFRPFGWLLARIFSRRLQQLNVPLRPLDSSLGITSDVLKLADARGQVRYTAWLRRLLSSGSVLYAGVYSTTRLACGPCVKVVFPLPNGNAIVLMEPRVDEKGAFEITSSGRRFGDPGFYFTVHAPDGRMWARYVRTMRESIRVYPAENGCVRTDHTLTIWRTVFLRLHYRLQRRAATAATPTSAP